MKLPVQRQNRNVAKEDGIRTFSMKHNYMYPVAATNSFESAKVAGSSRTLSQRTRCHYLRKASRQFISMQQSLARTPGKRFAAQAMLSLLKE